MPYYLDPYIIALANIFQTASIDEDNVFLKGLIILGSDYVCLALMLSTVSIVNAMYCSNKFHVFWYNICSSFSKIAHANMCVRGFDGVCLIFSGELIRNL